MKEIIKIDKKIIIFKFLIPAVLIAAFVFAYLNIDNPAIKTSKNSGQNKASGNSLTNIDVNEPDKSIAANVDAVSDPNEKSDCAYIVFTFDDGYLSDYELAYPILKKYGICGTSYIIPKFQDENKPYTMTWDEIKEMKKYGWDFGCHTYAHTDLNKMTDNEIVKSMEMVNDSFKRQGLEAPIIHAFPFGSYNKKAIEAMKPYRVQMRQAFYESKFVDLDNVNPYEIHSISADMRTEKRLKLHENLVDKAYEEKAVVVFRCHGLYKSKLNDMGKWPVQTDSTLFEKLVKYCVDKGCKFITMTDLIKMYS